MADAPLVASYSFSQYRTIVNEFGLDIPINAFGFMRFKALRYGVNKLPGRNEAGFLVAE